jgi:cytochrome b561
MCWRLGRILFWMIMGLVAAAFLLAVIGEEVSSPHARELVLVWHEWLGLLSLPVLVAMFVVRRFVERPSRSLMPHWLPWLRRATEVALYVLLVLQPLSGWLLASHAGKLASFFDWPLPSLASPSGPLADFGFVYHGLGGILILLIAALRIRVNITAYVLSLLVSVRRGRRAKLEARKHLAGDDSRYT